MKTKIAALFLSGLGMLCLPSAFAVVRYVSSVADACVATALSANPAAASQARLSTSFGRMPMRFEANHGQSAAPVKFLARGNGYALFLTPQEAVLRLQDPAPTPANSGKLANPGSGQAAKSAVLRLQLTGANPAPQVQGVEELPGKSNYLVGRMRRAWCTNVTNFARVEYRAVYPGIDLVWYGNQQQLEHDFSVAPGADPRRIHFAVEGAQQLRRADDGALIMEVAGVEVRLLKPVAYQQTVAGRREVDCAYVIDARQQVSFKLGAYDAAQTLVIDPVLLYSTFLGGNTFDQGLAIAVDQNRNAYVVGLAGSTDFPGPSPLKQTPPQDYADAYIAKLNPTGTALVYSTWLGGSRDEIASGIAVDKDGLAYVTGQTFSDDFPTTTGAVQARKNGVSDAFIAKLNTNGTGLVYGTLLGGNQSEAGAGIAVDASGSAYLVGSSDSLDLLSIRSATGIQSVRGGNPLYKSANQAGNWMSSSTGIKTASVNALAVDPKTPSLVYAGTPEGLYRSTDSGANWALLSGATAPPGTINAIAIDPITTSTLYVTNFNGVYKSTDGGQTWQQKQLAGGGNTSTVVLDPKVPTTLYVGTLRGAFKSTNGGETWTPINPGLNNQPGNPNATPAQVNSLAIDPVTPTTLYAGTNLSVFKTTNGGTNWVSSNNGLVPGIRLVAVDPKTPNIVYAAPSFGGLFKSTDGAATWTSRNTGLGTLNTPVVLSFALDPATPTTLYAGTNFGGVFKSTDGALNWSASNTGLRNGVLFALAVDPVNSANIYAGANTGSDAFAAKLNPAGTALSWLTYVGGAETETGRAIAVDGSGNAYVAGQTLSQDFSATNSLGAPGTVSTDAFITKINAAGTAFVYSNRFGGANTDGANGVAVSATGQAVIVGVTNSSNFPAVAPLQSALGSNGINDAFIARLNAAGTAFEFATWLGGNNNDAANAVALDSSGNIYVAGLTRSADFPLRDSLQSPVNPSTNDAFIAKLSAANPSLLYSTALGGLRDDQANGIAVDAQGAAYVVGSTLSLDFPVVNPLQMTLRGISNAFVAKLGIEADLALTKIGSRDPVMVNNNFSYALNVTNRGPSPATGVSVTDQLPTGLNFVSATASTGTCTHNASTVTCQLGNLAVQGSANITLSVTPTAAGTITNTASVTANEADPEAANNQANVQTTVLTLPSIYGRVKLANGTPLANVAVALNGTVTAAQQTNSNGVFQFANLQSGGNYTVTPTFGGYSFEPPTRTFNGLNADHAADFIATVCAYAIAPTYQSFGANGGSGTITMTATARCPWTAVASDSWITFNGAANGSGNGSVNFTVAATTVPRVGRMTIGGQIFAIFQGVNACAAPKFTVAAYRGVSNGTQLETGDFNGDGRTDLVMMSTLQGNNPIVILINTGSGEFVRWVELPGPSSLSSSLAAGDYNADGKLDIAFTNGGPAYLQVFLNQGNGTFTALNRISLESTAGRVIPIALYNAELNRDNRPDLVIANDTLVNFPYDVTVLLNQGNGTFSAPLQFSLGTARGVVDVNGDGISDLITGYSFSQRDLRVLLGDGFGSFGLPLSSEFTAKFGRSAFADFNGDGKLDLATVTFDPNGVALLLGDGKGKFSQSMTVSTEGNLDRLVVSDLNNDAKPDVALADVSRLVVWLGDGAGKLGLPIETGFDREDIFSAALSAGHFNVDNSLDLVGVDYNSGSARVYTNRCGAADGSIITGRVGDRFAGIPFANVTMKLSGARTATTPTDDGGNYIFTGLAPSGNYTVTPERAGAEFMPPSASFTNLTADQSADFIGQRKVAVVSAASYSNRTIAPDSIVAVFGVELTRRSESAAMQPLPISLADVQVGIGPGFGGGLETPLFFASPSQINLLVPAEMRLGGASLEVYSSNGSNPFVSSSLILIEKVVPGLFTANANGQGVTAAVALRIKADGSQVYEAVTRLDPMTNRFVAVPLEVSNVAEQVFLLLFGTGLRNHSGLANVSARVGGEAAEVSFAGKQGELAGLDQVNLRVPRTLTGHGEVDIMLTVDGKTANTVRVGIK